MGVVLKRCTKCNINKPVQFYGRFAAAPDQLKAICRACISVYNREYKNRNLGAGPINAPCPSTYWEKRNV